MAQRRVQKNWLRGADAVLAGADGALAVGEGASAALTAFRSFMAVAAPVIEVAGAVLNVLCEISMFAKLALLFTHQLRIQK